MTRKPTTTAATTTDRWRVLRPTLGIALAVGVEVYLYLSYRSLDARFHWFTHVFVGASLALLIMSAVTAYTRRPVPLPLAWLILGHLVAMVPDFLFAAGIAHQRWMDVFLGHLSSHFIPGRNVTWYVIFLASLALYLVALDRMGTGTPRRQGAPKTPRSS